MKSVFAQAGPQLVTGTSRLSYLFSAFLLFVAIINTINTLVENETLGIDSVISFHRVRLSHNIALDTALTRSIFLENCLNITKEININQLFIC